MAHYELNDEKHRIELYFDDEFPWALGLGPGKKNRNKRRNIY